MASLSILLWWEYPDRHQRLHHLDLRELHLCVSSACMLVLKYVWILCKWSASTMHSCVEQCVQSIQIIWTCVSIRSVCFHALHAFVELHVQIMQIILTYVSISLVRLPCHDLHVLRDACLHAHRNMSFVCAYKRAQKYEFCVCLHAHPSILMRLLAYITWCVPTCAEKHEPSILMHHLCQALHVPLTMSVHRNVTITGLNSGGFGGGFGGGGFGELQSRQSACKRLHAVVACTGYVRECVCVGVCQ